jgi:ABC-type antimicrobial peptide transport system permease subunit
MIFKNLFRRKERTLLTVLGIGIGVAAIIGLSSLADSLESGYQAVATGSKADFVLSDPEAYDIIISSVDESIGDDLLAMPEVETVSAMIQGLVQAEGTPYFFVFSYPADSFVLERFQVVSGVGLYSREADEMRGKPLLLGLAAAESLNKEVGDVIRVGDGTFRVVGIYETGEAFEEGAALLRTEDAQNLLGMQHKASLFYIRVKDPALGDRLKRRVERKYPALHLGTTADMANKDDQADSLRGMVIIVSILAVTIGGLGMMNAQLMSVMERTREIGVLRAVGWSSFRVLLMILGESLAVGLLGGLVGVGLAWLMLFLFSDQITAFGATTAIRPALLLRGFGLVFTLGLVGGLYPAHRASQLQPIEALRYEGGSAGKEAKRLPVGGLALQNLWRRKSRTLLTVGAIGITVGAVMALDAFMRGATGMMTGFFTGSEVVVRQADIADLSLSLLDERVGERIAAMPDVKYASGMLVGWADLEDMGWFVLMGHEPRGVSITEFNVIEGQRIATNHQIMVGHTFAEANDIEVGETLAVGSTRFRVVGIYEADVPFLEMGGVVTLRDAQVYTGHPRKVTLLAAYLHDPNKAQAVADEINASFPEVHAAVTGEFAEQLPDMQNASAMAGGMAVMATILGGVGMMNTMLMTVLERTREIGVLRALGWRRRQILGLILREALAMGAVGAAAGVGVAFGLAAVVNTLPFYGDAITPVWETSVFVRSVVIALTLGLLGGLYPAYRATRMQPVEALRYE